MSCFLSRVAPPNHRVKHDGLGRRLAAFMPGRHRPTRLRELASGRSFCGVVRRRSV